MRTCASARALFTNDNTSPTNSLNESKLAAQESKANASTFQVENCDLNIPSTSVHDLDIIRQVRSHSSQAGDETELQDPSLAAPSNLSRDRLTITRTPKEPLYKRIGKSVKKFLFSSMSLPAVSCLVSLLIALVPQLKALFVQNVPGVNMPNAPDGQPPLEWILDIANFGGNNHDLSTNDRCCICAHRISDPRGIFINIESSAQSSTMVSHPLAITHRQGKYWSHGCIEVGNIANNRSPLDSIIDLPLATCE
jgi:hypothetical protein